MLEFARRHQSALVEWAKTIALSVVITFVFITFIGQSFVVEGVSMLPNLHDGERLLVDKLSYRFRDPQHGEVIVFHFPANPKEMFIKRVIGLPGDTISVQNDTVYLNGKPLEEPYIQAPMVRSLPVRQMVIPEDHYFVLGDNRNQSLDSRSPLVGLIPRSAIVGRALVRYWPLTRIGEVERFISVY